MFVSVGLPMSYSNGVPGGNSFVEHAPGRSPSFPPSSTPDFLSSLSQMGENIAPNDMVSVEKHLSQQQSSNEHMAAMSQQLDGKNNRPLRHPTPGTPSTGNAPQTPSSLSPVRSSSSSSQSLVRTTTGGPASNGMGAVCTMASDNCNANNNKLSSQPAHNTVADSLNNDLNFDPAAIIDGDGPGQEGLDVSYAPY